METVVQFVNEWIISLLIFLPLLGALGLALVPSPNKNFTKLYTLGLFLVQLILSGHLIYHFQNSGAPDQFYQTFEWIEAWNVTYSVGLDGVSVLLIVLTTITMPLALLGTWNSIDKKHKAYAIALLTLQSSMVGVFAALDLFLFYIFWEVMLIPMYLLIGIWGGENRIYATLKFFIYTMAGSAVMLVAILYLYQKGDQSFHLFQLYNYKLPYDQQKYLFWAFALAFAIKIPLFPFHTWLPDAHVQAPTIGSVVLAGVLLKMGAYGFYRLAMPLFPDAIVLQQPLLVVLSVVGIIYGALVAMIQTDIKKLVAYSSVSHMGVVMLGLFSLNLTGVTGGLYQMFNHAVSTGALFLLVGMIYDRTHTRQIKDYSGLAKLMPVYTVFFLIITFSSIGVPLTNGFVGEFLTLLGAFQMNKLAGILGATGVVLGAIYMLWLVERVFYGTPKQTKGVEKGDLNLREILVMSTLVVFVFWMGIFPKPFLQTIERSAETTLLKLTDERELVQAGKLTRPLTLVTKVAASE